MLLGLLTVVWFLIRRECTSRRGEVACLRAEVAASAPGGVTDLQKDGQGSDPLHLADCGGGRWGHWLRSLLTTCSTPDSGCCAGLPPGGGCCARCQGRRASNQTLSAGQPRANSPTSTLPAGQPGATSGGVNPTLGGYSPAPTKRWWRREALAASLGRRRSGAAATRGRGSRSGRGARSVGAQLLGLPPSHPPTPWPATAHWRSRPRRARPVQRAARTRHSLAGVEVARAATRASRAHRPLRAPRPRALQPQSRHLSRGWRRPLGAPLCGCAHRDSRRRHAVGRRHRAAGRGRASTWRR